MGSKPAGGGHVEHVMQWEIRGFDVKNGIEHIPLQRIIIVVGPGL